MIEFSALDMLLMNYAAGTLNPAEQLIVAAHVALNVEGRRRLARFEALGGRMMEKEPPAKMKDGCLDGVMQKIKSAQSAPEKKEPCAAAEKTVHGLCIPQSIYEMMSGHCLEKTVCWKQVTDGVETFNVRVAMRFPCSRKLRLLHVAPNRATPAHRHRGREITVVLDGEYHDEYGTYRRGDIVIINDPRVVHTPAAGPHGCLCLVLTDSPLRFANPFTQIYNFFLRI